MVLSGDFAVIWDGQYCWSGGNRHSLLFRSESATLMISIMISCDDILLRSTKDAPAYFGFPTVAQN
jgi:hypothetical protein